MIFGPSRLLEHERDDLKDEVPPSLLKLSSGLRNFSAFFGVAPVGKSFILSLLSITVSS